jgi:hypothetical protein
MGAISALRPSPELRDGTHKWFLNNEFGKEAETHKVRPLETKRPPRLARPSSEAGPTEPLGPLLPSHIVRADHERLRGLLR